MHKQTGFLDGLAFRSLLGFCVAICALGPGLQAQATPKIISFDAPGAGATGGFGTYAARMNSQGEIVGYFTDSGGVYPYLRMPNGLITTFSPRPNATPPSVASAINDDGVIAGTYLAGPRHGLYAVFLRATDGTITTFGGAPDMSVVGLTDADVVAGSYSIGCGNPDYDCQSIGYLRAPDGSNTNFSATGAVNTYVTGLNANGTVVGYYTDSNSVIHGYVWTPGGTISTIDVGGAGTAEGQGTYVVGATGKGIIAGDYVDGSGMSHGYVLEPTGDVKKFNVSGTMGGEGTYVTALNGKVAITGDYADSSGVYHGYVRTPNGNVTTFDAPGAGATAGQGTFPASINATDVIAGDYIDGSGVYHGFVRTP